MKTWGRFIKPLHEGYSTQECGKIFTSRKARCEPSLTLKQRKTRLQCAKGKLSWTVDDWMKGSPVMNHQSALDKEIMLELLFGSGPMKHIKMTTRRKQTIFHNH